MFIPASEFPVSGTVAAGHKAAAAPSRIHKQLFF